MVSGTITDASGRTLDRSDPGSILISVSHFPMFSVGLNCALGAEQLRPFVEELSAKAGTYVLLTQTQDYPINSGYDQSAEFMLSVAEDFMKEGW